MTAKHIDSKYIFGGLVATMIVIKFYDLLLAPNKVFAGRIAEFSWMEILITAVLGALGLILYKKAGFPDFDNKDIRKPRNILISIGLGFLFSLLLVLLDSFARIGDLSVGWPLSPIFYIWGAISSETVFRLFAVSLLVWLFGNIILKRRYGREIFWICAVLLSGLAAFSMLAAFSNPQIPLTRPNDLLFALLGIIVFSSELTAYGLLKKYGFLSGLIFRLSFYLIWHITWPVIFY